MIIDAFNAQKFTEWCKPFKIFDTTIGEIFAEAVNKMSALVKTNCVIYQYSDKVITITPGLAHEQRFWMSDKCRNSSSLNSEISFSTAISSGLTIGFSEACKNRNIKKLSPLFYKYGHSRASTWSEIDSYIGDCVDEVYRDVTNRYQKNFLTNQLKTEQLNLPLNCVPLPIDKLPSYFLFGRVFYPEGNALISEDMSDKRQIIDIVRNRAKQLRSESL